MDIIVDTSGESRDGERGALALSDLEDFADVAFADFELRRRALNRLLEAAVANQVLVARNMQDAATASPGFTADDAEKLLLGVQSLDPGDAALNALIPLTQAEVSEQDELRERAAALGERLPFDRLSAELELDEFEADVVMLCAAAELDRAYGRLFGFILDNLNRQTPSIELLCTLGKVGVRERIARRRALSAHARLRRSGLVWATENAERPLHTTICLAPSVFRRLTQPGPWSDRFFDPARVTDAPLRLDSFPDRDSLNALAAALRHGTVEACGVWGSREHGVSEAVAALADAVNRPLFRVSPVLADLDATLAAAEDRHGMLWVHVDDFTESMTQFDTIRAVLADRLGRSALCVCLSGEFPWRPTGLLADRNYAELRMREATGSSQKRLWHESFEELDESQTTDVAARYRLSPREVQAVARVTRAASNLGAPAEGRSLTERLNEACTQVTQRHGMRFTRLVVPKRGPGDLVLPEALHRQVLEVARFYRSLLRVDDEWGFQRIATGRGGIKTLFTGESGTGKTLAAEVIAGQLNLALMKVDLSRLVSKWVGETEKNLDSAFREAEDSHAVLFIDEADSVCGKRGEIRGGSDRYANLEVGFLLQRLEQYGGLAILATNLRDEMDPAFIRRFQLVLHFTRPGEAERRRLWHASIPASAPLEPGIDFDALVRLDMTGASIAGAARMAALLAADESSDRIRESHLREGIRRQFRQEARLLNEEALKPRGRAEKQWR